MSPRKILSLIAGPLAFLTILVVGRPEGMSPEAQRIIASTLWIAIWWITEAIPVGATSLLPLILFPLTGAVPIKEAAKGYSNPLIYLFVGGFILALAMERWNLHKRIALNIIMRAGTDMRGIVLGFMLATGGLSMWISNTATTMMMLPIALAIISQFKEFERRNPEDIKSGPPNEHSPIFGKALMLSIAYAASIGGLATLVGTPTNIIFSGFVHDTYGFDISFAQWMKVGMPVSITLLLICWLYLVRIAYPLSSRVIPGSKQSIRRQLSALGSMSWEEKWTLAIFGLVAFSWITRKFLIAKLLPGIDDTMIALIGALALFMIPARSWKGEMIMDWKTAAGLPWGILILFGAGFSIANGFDATGLASWIGTQLTLLEGVSLILILLAIITLVNFLTEITLNMATVSMIMPVLAALAPAIGLHPYGLMVGACLAGSCAFMFPIATAPNAIVFGSGLLRMEDMARTGIWLNLISIALITLFLYFLMPYLWQLDLATFPPAFAK